ncbi:MAG: Gfo/Idh/MocA family oxidoreductase [Oscillospiraceae bacterium]
MQMKRAAIIGLGDIAKIHLPTLKAMDNVELVAVCDIDEGKKDFAGDVPFYKSVKKLLREVKPDVVHICLPHYLHYPIAEIAAREGTNIFCEKPLAMTSKEAYDFVALADDHPKLHFGICLQNRYNRSSETLLQIVKSGEYGKVTGVKGIVAWHRPKEYYEASPWRGIMDEAGGGVMINQSIHTLDLMQYFAGEIISLRGNMCQLLDYGIEVEDTAVAHIRFENGAKGLFMASIANSKNDNIEVGVVLEGAEYLIADNALYKITDGVRELVCQDERLPGTKFYYGAGHAKAIGAYYKALIEGTDDYIHVREGVNSMRMIDAIRISKGSITLL